MRLRATPSTSATTHRRTLDRQMEDPGATFRALVGGVRFAVAAQLLEHTRISLTEIVYARDCAAPSTFNRAFRRWSGVLPTPWRAGRMASIP